MSSECQVTVVSVAGSVSSTARAHEVADRVLEVVPVEGPVIVDLSRVDVDADELAWLVLRFEAAPHWHRFRLVDDRIGQRRRLRELCRRVPVLPDVATALAGARTEVPVDTPVLDIVDLWGGAEPAPSTAAPPKAAAPPTAAPPEPRGHPRSGHPSRARSLGSDG